jgi:hypothetical protein
VNSAPQHTGRNRLSHEGARRGCSAAAVAATRRATLRCCNRRIDRHKACPICPPKVPPTDSLLDRSGSRNSEEGFDPKRSPVPLPRL